MKTQEQKKQEFYKLKERFERARITIFTSFAKVGEPGLNVKSLRELKKALTALQADFIVHKKTILAKALKASKKTINIFDYEGSLATVFGYANESAIAKSIYTFAKKNQAFRYFSAFLRTDFLDQTAFTNFAKLPSRDMLIARILGLLQYPMRSLVVVLDQIAKK